MQLRSVEEWLFSTDYGIHMGALVSFEESSEEYLTQHFGKESCDIFSICTIGWLFNICVGFCNLSSLVHLHGGESPTQYNLVGEGAI